MAALPVARWRAARPAMSVSSIEPARASLTAHATSIKQPLALGCQAVLGIFVQSANGGPGLNSNVTLTGNTVDEDGKNGITANEPGTFVTVTSNTVLGRGAVGLGDAAQNGVQIGFGARGLVSGNTISANFYTPPDF